MNQIHVFVLLVVLWVLMLLRFTDAQWESRSVETFPKHCAKIIEVEKKWVCFDHFPESAVEGVNALETLRSGDRLTRSQNGVLWERGRMDPSMLQSLGALVDLNEGRLEELMVLPGIGPSLAKAILSYRRIHGPFRHEGELLGVRGIGPKLVSQLRGKYFLRRPRSYRGKGQLR